VENEVCEEVEIDDEYKEDEKVLKLINILETRRKVITDLLLL